MRAGLVVLAFVVACDTEPVVPEGPCPGGVCAAAEDPACAGVVCQSPPTACHLPQGTCAGGTCSYDVDLGAACDDGNACTTADTCQAGGICGGTALSCDTPPGPTCLDANTSRVFDSPGTCSAGQCIYEQRDVTCTGACDNLAGICPNACDSVVCDTPPSGCFGTPGTCTDGSCSYVASGGGTACDDGSSCTSNDTCQSNGACLGELTVCNEPPASECVGDSVRIYSSIGAACLAGSCMYGFVDEMCPSGCSDGACVGACDPSGCDKWKLPATPNGVSVRTCVEPDCAVTRTLPTGLDLNFFQCNVQPVMNETCSTVGCHSERTVQRRLRIYRRVYTRAGNLLDGKGSDGPLDLDTCGGGNCSVDPLSAFETQWNYDNARLIAAEAHVPTGSELVRRPLATDASGLVHDGFDIFRSTKDIRYRTLLAWLGGATTDVNCGGAELPVPFGCENCDGAPVANLDNYGCPNCPDPNAPSGMECFPGLPATATQPCSPVLCGQ